MITLPGEPAAGSAAARAGGAFHLSPCADAVADDDAVEEEVLDGVVAATTCAPPERSVMRMSATKIAAPPTTNALRTLVPVAADGLVVRVGHARVVLDAVAASLGLVRLHPAPAIARVVEEDVARAARVVHVGVALLHRRARDVAPVRVLVVEVVRRVRMRAARERAGAGHLPDLGDVARAVR